jgi:H/ACA ribonucleoprotein complex subunit 2
LSSSDQIIHTFFSASKAKSVRRGVKEVVKAVQYQSLYLVLSVCGINVLLSQVRKGEKGICIIAGDISPIDVISHLPVLCEDNDVPYIFVTSKEALGLAGQTKRPTSCVLIKPGTDSDLKEKYQEVHAKVKGLQQY